MSLFSKIFNYILLTSAKYKIDASHNELHSMNVLFYANEIYQDELKRHPQLKLQEDTIFCAAALHDMVDSKYRDEKKALPEINKLIKSIYTDSPNNIQNSGRRPRPAKIITTMGYAKVKKNGFPEFNCMYKNKAFHIVREADLLTAYDFDRCLIYNLHHHEINKKHVNFPQTLQIATKLFEERTFKHHTDNLFTTNYARANFMKLHNNAITRIKFWNKMIKK